jgi:C1A family cysteine protease
MQQETKTLVIERLRESAELPEKYDYRQEGRAVSVRDQGTYGTCWAFASLTALETALMPEETLDLSRDHLNFHNSYLLSTDEGGSYIMSMAYLTGWQGPVLEEDDPYGDNESPSGLSPVCHVQEVRMPDSKDYETIKQTVYLHGGVESTLYMDFTDSDEESFYYNKENYSYCYDGQEAANHDVVIIGWDDTYPAENFNIQVPGDGAFICQNSWGKNFGEDGYFYVSYYDTNIGSYNVAYTKVEAADNYDILYQSDLCGWSGQIGYNSDTAYFANVYEAEEEQEIRAVGFYAAGGDTEYRLAVVTDFEDSSSLKELKYTQSGYLQYTGYYTVELEEPVKVEAGKKFAIAVQVTTPDCSYPIAVEFAASELGDAVILEDGEGYISPDGRNWACVEETQESNLCLKAYANRIQE